MPPLNIVIVKPFSQACSRLFNGNKRSLVDMLYFEQSKKGFHWRIIIWIAFTAHTSKQLMQFTVFTLTAIETGQDKQAAEILALLI
jgi:hypothetical protein